MLPGGDLRLLQIVTVQRYVCLTQRAPWKTYTGVQIVVLEPYNAVWGLFPNIIGVDASMMCTIVT